MNTPTVTILAFATPAANKRFSIVAQTGGVMFGGTVTSDGSSAAEISFDFYGDAGSYALDVFHTANNNRCVYTLTIDGAAVGTVDGYNATSVAKRDTIAGPVVLTAGRHRLRITCATKNASSTGFLGVLSAIVLRGA